MSGIGVICFASCYAIALGLEAMRLLFRSTVRAALMLGFAGAGLFAHTVYLFYHVRQWHFDEPRVGTPLSSPHDWCLIAAWLLVLVYLYLTYFHPKHALGLFLWPLVLGLIGAAQLAPQTPFKSESASKVWGIIHGSSIMLGVVAILVGSAAGLMYLEQAWRLKHKRPQWNLPLPSLEWLQRANARAVVIATVAFGLGILSGMLLNLSRDPSAGKLRLWDPLVLATSALFLWLLISGLVGLAYRPAREGHKVAYWTLVGVVFLVIALLILLSNVTQHGGVKGEAAQARCASETPLARSASEGRRPFAGLKGRNRPAPGNARGTGRSILPNSPARAGLRLVRGAVVPFQGEVFVRDPRSQGDALGWPLGSLSGSKTSVASGGSA